MANGAEGNLPVKQSAVMQSTYPDITEKQSKFLKVKTDISEFVRCDMAVLLQMKETDSITITASLGYGGRVSRNDHEGG